jgi:hypothetical protein
MSHDSHVNYALICSLHRILVLIIKTLLLICPFVFRTGISHWRTWARTWMTPVAVPGPQGTSLLCEGKHSSLTITTLTQAPALHLQLY